MKGVGCLSRGWRKKRKIDRIFRYTYLLKSFLEAGVFQNHSMAQSLKDLTPPPPLKALKTSKGGMCVYLLSWIIQFRPEQKGFIKKETMRVHFIFSYSIWNDLLGALFLWDLFLCFSNNTICQLKSPVWKCQKGRREFLESEILENNTYHISNCLVFFPFHTIWKK